MKLIQIIKSAKIKENSPDGPKSPKGVTVCLFWRLPQVGKRGRRLKLWGRI